MDDVISMIIEFTPSFEIFFNRISHIVINSIDIYKS